MSVNISTESACFSESTGPHPDGHLCMKLSPCKAWKAEDFELPGQDFNPSLMGSPDNATELLKECTA